MPGGCGVAVIPAPPSWTGFNSLQLLKKWKELDKMSDWRDEPSLCPKTGLTFGELEEGDVLLHRDKRVVAVKNWDEWGYINNGHFVPFFGCEDHTDAIVFDDGVYFDLDYCAKIGNVFKYIE